MNDKAVYDPHELVKDLADKIGIHQLYAIVRELRGEPEATPDIMDGLMKVNEELKAHISYLQEQLTRANGMIDGLKFALRCNGVSSGDVG